MRFTGGRQERGPLLLPDALERLPGPRALQILGVCFFFVVFFCFCVWMARGVRKRAERNPSNLIRLMTGVGKPLASPAASSAPISSPSLEDADMSAIPDDFIRKTARLSAEVTRPFPNSKKIYVQGSRSDVRVG